MLGSDKIRLQTPRVLEATCRAFKSRISILRSDIFYFWTLSATQSYSPTIKKRWCRNSIRLPKCRIIRHNSCHAALYPLFFSRGHRTPANESTRPICRPWTLQLHVHANAIRCSSLPRSFDQRLGQIPERAAHRRRGGGHNRFHRNAHDRGARAHTRRDQDEIGEGARDGGGRYFRD